MHMADALLAPAVAGTMYAFSAVAAGYSTVKVRKENNPIKIPQMGVMGAFVFGAQMINFTIPGTGSSGHLCGGMMLSAMLGPFGGFLTMIGILLIQCLMFADGGILALGANVWNMAFYGCFIGSFIFWKGIACKKPSKAKIMLASVLGCIITLQLGAFSVTLQTLLSGVSELPFGVFVAAMQPIHLAIGLVEGLITGAVLCYVYEARADLLWGMDPVKKENRMSAKVVIASLAAAFAVIAGGLSLLASSLPDGLEWSIERLTGDTEVASNGAVYDALAAAQEKIAVLPDYAFKGSEAAVGTTVSGLVGGVMVILLCVACCYVFRFYKHKEQK